ncbi:MAG: hypothetical protein KKB30_01665 [Proteobacteria bacterium]|nr:hypothetical protein [Pseudomonadota bacterium]MBU1716803.1 hypothetical protein [Pseudomonadota bacterium]
MVTIAAVPEIRTITRQNSIGVNQKICHGKELSTQAEIMNDSGEKVPELTSGKTAKQKKEAKSVSNN